MSMFIRGINPPKSCYTCDWYNKVQCPVDVSKCYYKMTRHPSCPLISIPTPHGRLGDLDELVKTLEQNRLCYVSDIDDEAFELGTNRAIDAVRNANTIIKAEE